MRNFVVYIVFIFLSIQMSAQNYLERRNSLDIEKYKLTLALNDSSNVIHAKMQVQLKFIKNSETFWLDFNKLDSISGLGMQIDSLFQNAITVPYTHEGNRLTISPKHPFPGISYTFTIFYHGIPKDGLIIGENRHGNRTFFADNWPDRAQHWMPCVDHPSDKASIEYVITVPDRYKVVANGLLVEESTLPENRFLYHWKTSHELPTKVMVIGAAEFATETAGTVNEIPVTTWVYPERKADGFYDFSIAPQVLSFFMEKFGEYPYDKLANVQSTTRYGGMENAGTIFYYESSVTGKQQHENLIAHEIAHQWFGNAVSEIDWPHVWLSEGFATYLTDLYIRETKGEAAFRENMKTKRNNIFAYNSNNPLPVVDFNFVKITDLLNVNSYQKGAFVLHMLRNEIGEASFWNGLQTYYRQFKHGNASTDDFKRVMAAVSGKNLDVFFEQWLYGIGKPILKTFWIYHDNKVRLTLNQLQKKVFEFPLDIALIHKDGTREIKTISVRHRSLPYVIESTGDVVAIELDPNCNLLFESDSD